MFLMLGGLITTRISVEDEGKQSGGCEPEESVPRDESQTCTRDSGGAGCGGLRPQLGGVAVGDGCQARLRRSMGCVANPCRKTFAECSGLVGRVASGWRWSRESAGLGRELWICRCGYSKCDAMRCDAIQRGAMQCGAMSVGWVE